MKASEHENPKNPEESLLKHPNRDADAARYEGTKVRGSKSRMQGLHEVTGQAASGPTGEAEGG